MANVLKMKQIGKNVWTMDYLLIRKSKNLTRIVYFHKIIFCQIRFFKKNSYKAYLGRRNSPGLQLLSPGFLAAFCPTTDSWTGFVTNHLRANSSEVWTDCTADSWPGLGAQQLCKTTTDTGTNEMCARGWGWIPPGCTESTALCSTEALKHAAMNEETQLLS